VVDGHTESVSVKLKRQASIEEVGAALREFRGRPQELALPSAPANPVVVLTAPDRPQPRLDVEAGAGMAAVVGRLRPCPVFDFKFTVLSHNTVRGAAGAALLNAELLRAEGYI
jgi:aspartate-semialdehyde dehydrogenase